MSKGFKGLKHIISILIVVTVLLVFGQASIASLKRRQSRQFLLNFPLGRYCLRNKRISPCIRQHNQAYDAVLSLEAIENGRAT